MKLRNNPNQKGFSLIEVMIAVLVLGIGILAVSKLQGTLIKSGADANERSAAASLIQRKADDLRRFIHITTSEATVPDVWSSTITSPLSIAYKHIATNKGGLIENGSITVGNTEYNLTWTVKDYYYSGTDTKATTTPSTASYPDFKMAHIIATWDSASSINNVVSFDTVIEAYRPSSTALDTNPTTGGTGPVIPYDPQQQPDVVPITLGIDGLKKETTKPLPDLSRKGDSVLVKFETVTYSNSLDTVKREEFTTLNCYCTNQGGSNNPVSRLYGLTTWDDTEEKVIDTTSSQSLTISKTNVDNSGSGEISGSDDQAPECYTCCRDGDDITTSGSTTFKVCRMKRVDGILRVFTDPWKMFAFNVIPATYFNDADGKAGMTSTLQQGNIDLYSSYIASLVRSVLVANVSKTDFENYTTVDTTFHIDATSFVNTSIDHKSFDQNISETIQARALYIDFPPDGVYTKIENQSTLYTAATVPLDRIPFYEINMTELAGWIPDEDQLVFGVHDPSYTKEHDSDDCSGLTGGNARNCISNEELADAGAYERGMFNADTVTTLDIAIGSRIYTNSDGVVDRDRNAGNIDKTINSTVSLTVSP